MAMPTDFWRNEQSLNIFRTKPCQRLFRDGVCAWKSQCQFSHCLEWPRRQPRRHNYSPEVCPHIRVTTGVNDGSAVAENLCILGLRCPKAHSKEEVLFHPSIFKTILCEEHSNHSSGNQRNARNAKRHKCHRYYCPFAHGTAELRTSDLSQEVREQCLRALDIFPSDVCCNACTRHWITHPTQASQEEAKYQGPPGLDLQGPPGMDLRAPFPWPAKVPPPPQPVGPQAPLWGWLNAQSMTQPSPLTEALTQFAPAARERKLKEAIQGIKPTDDGTLPPFNPFRDDGVYSMPKLPLEDGMQPPYKPAGELQRTLQLHGEPRDTLDSLDNLGMPAFINIADDGSTSVGGPQQSVKNADAISQNKKARDLLGALFFELL